MMFCVLCFAVGLFLEPRDLVRAYFHVVQTFKEAIQNPNPRSDSDLEDDEEDHEKRS